jgi:Divergent InlB B-repeat domain
VLGPVTETAQFQYRPTQPPATFSLAVGETGLPNGTAWSVALGALGASGATASLTVVGLNGTYGLTAPTIYTASGVRWVSNAVNLSTTVIANGTFSVAYSEQYQVSVLGASGGSVTPLGVEWVAPGTVVDLAAVANSTSVFLSWNGTGTGNYTGTSASTTVTVTGPITEQVAFGPQPVSQKSTSTSASNGELTAIGLLVVLLVVGLLVGLLLGRRRSPPPATEADAVPMEVPMDTSDDLAATAPMAEYDEGPGPS